MAEVVWTSFAEYDLKAIFDFIAQDSSFYAGAVIDNLYERVAILKMHKKAGRVVPEFQNPLIRELIEGNYRIIYEIRNEDLVAVLTVVHRAMMLKNKFRLTHE